MYKRLMLSVLLIALITFLGACKKDEPITVIVPYGSPEYVTLYMSQSDGYIVDVINGADPLVAAFGTDTYDVIVAPTNLGAKFYQSSPDYQLIASIVWGNYYLVSNHELTLNALNEQTIYSFGQNQTPDIILKYVLSTSNIEVSYSYLTSSLEVSTQFLLAPHDIYLIAEPALSQLKAAYDAPIYALDIQTLYTSLTNQNSYPQASVFAKSSLSDQMISQIQSDLMSSIESIQNIENIAETKALLTSDLTTDELMTSIVQSHLNYISAVSAKPLIETYFQLIMNQNPALVGGTLPIDSFYR